MKKVKDYLSIIGENGRETLIGKFEFEDFNDNLYLYSPKTKYNQTVIEYVKDKLKINRTVMYEVYYELVDKKTKLYVVGAKTKKKLLETYENTYKDKYEKWLEQHKKDYEDIIKKVDKMKVIEREEN